MCKRVMFRCVIVRCPGLLSPKSSHLSQQTLADTRSESPVERCHKFAHTVQSKKDRWASGRVRVGVGPIHRLCHNHEDRSLYEEPALTNIMLSSYVTFVPALGSVLRCVIALVRVDRKCSAASPLPRIKGGAIER